MRALTLLALILVVAGCGTRTALDVGGGDPPTGPDPRPRPGDAPEIPDGGGLDAMRDARAPRADGSTPDGATPDADPRPDPGPRIQHLSAGWRHTCAVFAGHVWCWGFNGSGQLGDGTYIDRPEPVRVAGLEGAVEVSAGLQHSCALDSNGAMYCWGNNTIAQLGDGTFETRALPERVGGLGRVIGIAAAGEHTCALLESGEGRCWGHNAYGQVGDGTDIVRTAPTPVRGLANAIQIEAGRRHTCALLRDRTVSCWGQLLERTFEATRLPWGVNVEQASAGEDRTCVLTSAGEVVCDGARTGYRGAHVSVGDTFRCIADADGVICDFPGESQRIPGTEGAFQVSVGHAHACARLPTATVCFGSDMYGQLGDGAGDSGGTTVEVLGL